MRRSAFALAAVWATAACGKVYGDAGGEADAGAPVVDAAGPTDQDADAFVPPGDGGDSRDGASADGEAGAVKKPEAGIVEAGSDGATAPTWTAFAFTDVNRRGTCTGAKYVTFLSKYDLYLGVILCNSTRYKLYISKTMGGTYYEIGDNAGNGQDHCEFVNPAFRITNDDDVTSGGCTSCAVNAAMPLPSDGTANAGVFVRSTFGQTPVYDATWSASTWTASWYECGVSIP